MSGLTQQIEGSIIAMNAIMMTMFGMPEHFVRIVEQRLAGGAGSRYPQFEAFDEVVKAIENAAWETYSHPAIHQGCLAFKAMIPGEVGMISLSTLAQDTKVRLVDFKNTGFLSAVVESDKFVPVDYTIMIVGKADFPLPRAHDSRGRPNRGRVIGHDPFGNGLVPKNAVYTFHPGDPVTPSQIEGKERTVTVKEAMEMGFGLAKIEIPSTD